MGGQSYSYNAREERSLKNNFRSAPVEQIFKQQFERKAHESMMPQKIIFRESRDSSVNPNSYPIIIGLDVTGSMGRIPVELIREYLPKVVSMITEAGIENPAILFICVGDHKVDKYPLQVGQFESGDEQLDMWLTRSYLEGGGGGNNGESYSLVHYFAAHHVVTDNWEKRGKKGLLITVGDENNHKVYPKSMLKDLFESCTLEADATDVSLLEEASKKWEVFHISPGRNDAPEYWNNLLKERHVMSEPVDITNAIGKIVKGFVSETVEEKPSQEKPEKEKSKLIL